MIDNLFREHFPFFRNEREWIYLDSAATTLKPNALLNATRDFYGSAGSVHRSQYDLAQTESYELARDLVTHRFNVKSREAVIWTSGTTHSLNLVANGLAHQIEGGDEIVISIAEHHANFIPWQQLAKRCQAKLITLAVDDHYKIDPDELKKSLSAKTKIVALNLVSNVTGVRQPVETLIPIIRQHSSAKIVLDIAQAVCSEKVDVQKLDADYYAFSAHKMYGPTGVGVLTGKPESLEQLSPLFFGGKMLQDVTITSLSLAQLPYRLEAGTPNIAGIIGFGKVLEWLESWDFDLLNRGLYQLADIAHKRLKEEKNLQIIGSGETTPTISFMLKHQHHADVAAILTEQHIAIRAGEHCAKPYVRYLSHSGTVRISLAHYNNRQDLAYFFKALGVAQEILGD
ncbi:aminotransferase class V-fold PLP-dependent enzyme [Glaesserella sp.]|uniref:aminotransferase class V-fold PLP-dependent enzyme n=1 Tax=Glaesserella sp. TaxID=2094731 RepID=UPI0035A0BD99